MKQILVRDEFTIEGRGKVFVVAQVDHPGFKVHELDGEMIEAKGGVWTVIGTETFAIEMSVYPYVGLLVRPVS